MCVCVWVHMCVCFKELLRLYTFNILVQNLFSLLKHYSTNSGDFPPKPNEIKQINQQQKTSQGHNARGQGKNHCHTGKSPKARMRVLTRAWKNLQNWDLGISLLRIL